MVRTYRADDERLPELHDCVIDEIELTATELIIRFDADDLPGRDSAAYWFPQARTMEMRLQLTQQPVMCRVMALTPVYRHILPDSIHVGRYRAVPLHTVLGKQSRKLEERLEYLYNPYEDGALYIQLWRHGYLILRVEADTVQFVWSEA